MKQVMSNEIKRFMEEAIQIAIENVQSGNGGPFGAVIIKNGKIIGRGVNRVTQNNDPTAHAEVNAIREACKNENSFSLDNCEIYTTCEPCPMCLGAIYWAKIKRIYFGATKHDAAAIDFDDSFIYNEFSLPIEKRKIKTQQLMHDRSLEIFTLWESSDSKIGY